MSPKKSQNRKSPEKIEMAKAIPDSKQDLATMKIEQPEMDFPVVALAASAGGLEALEQFFSHLPEDSGMAYVVIQHLEPNAISSMPEILSRFTRLPVKITSDGLKIEANSIYLIPPGKNMGIRDGALFLEEPAQGPMFTVDFFFRSLAGEKSRKAIGIVLSGTGTDGTLGLREIKARMGTILVQEPASAKYQNMPRNAVETGLVDFILKPENMPRQLMRLKQTASDDAEKFNIANPVNSESLQQIFAILLTRTGHDFSGYKKATILRRLQRRMSVNQINDLQGYVHFLENNEKEASLLQNDLLIGVTAFFRDPEAFEALKVQLNELIKAKTPGGDLRVWVAGCATGEEAYSVTIVLAECLDELKIRLQVQVYGTDIDLESLRLARSGLFSVDIISEVSSERLQRYFVKERNGYRIRKEIREKVVFAVQDFTNDPPFSKMDLICCRNLLIYLENEPQKRLLPLLHYALVPGGLLFLGPSETVGESADLFNLLDRKWKIYQRREVAVSPERLKFPTSFTPPLPEISEEIVRDLTGNQIPELTEKIFLDKYAPTFAVVDEKYRLVYVRGRTGKFLEVGSGQPNWSILEMAREGLKTDLGTALFRATKEKKKNVREGVRVKTNGDFQTINLTVAPLEEPGIPSGYLMVVFQETDTAGPIGCVEIRSKSSKQTAELEEQLKMVRENLQTTVEELEATNEELKSANEELQSNNEELQSTNEELDTSREELQSLNEELSTTNADLRDKNDLLIKANDDLRNFLDRTDIAIIFLDEELKIRSFTPASCELYKLKNIDIGRPLEDINSNLAYDGVIVDAREVLRTLQNKKLEVQSKDKCWYTMRILPYRTVHNAISGLVLSFLDIDQQKRAVDDLVDVNDMLQEALEEQKKSEAEKARLLKESTENLDELQTLLDNAPVSIWIAHDPGCLTITGNIYANRLFGVQGGDNISKSAGLAEAAVTYKVVCNNRELRPEELPAQMAAATGKPVIPFEMELIFEDGRRLNMLIGAVPLLAADGRVRGAVAFGTDITERKKAEEALKESEERFRTLADAMPQLVWTANSDGVVDYYNARSVEYGVAVTALTDRDWAPALHPDDLAPTLEAWREAVARGVMYQKEQRLRVADGSYRWHLARAIPQRDKNGVIIKWFGTTTDIHDLKMAEVYLKASEDRLNRAQEIAHLGSWELDLVTNTLSWSNEVYRIFGLQPQEFGATYEAFLEAVHPEDRKAVDESYSRSKREGRDSYEIEHRIVRKNNGEIRYVHEKCTHFRDDSGKIIRSLGMVHDITERKQAEAEIVHLASFPGLNPNPIIELDSSGTIKYLNPAAKKTLSDLKELGLQHPFLADLEEIIEKKETDSIVKDIRIGDFWFEQTLAWAPSTQTYRIYARDITKRIQAEEALQTSQRQLQEIIDGAPNPIFVKDLEGKFITINSQLEKFLGKTREEIKGKTDYDIISMDQADNYRENDRRIAENDKPEQLEEEAYLADGKRHTFLANKFALHDIHGKTYAVASISTDLTEFKQGEKALKESEEKYRNLFVNMTEGFALCEIITDSTGTPIDYRSLEVNQAWEKLTGLTAAQVVGKGFKEIIPDLEQYWVDSYGKVALTGEPVHIENYNKFTDSWYEIYAYSPGKGYFVSLVQNITERKKAAEALQETLAYLNNLLDYANAPIIVWDPLFRVTQFNHAFERLTGRTSKEVIGKSLDILFPADSREHSMEHIRRALAGERMEVEEIPIQHKDGSVRTVLWNSATLYERDNKTPRATIAQGQDITERKKAEKQLSQRAEELETVMNLVPLAIWVAHDPKCNNITGNRTANEFYEAKEGENVSAGPAPGEPIPPRRFFRNGKELTAEKLPMQEAAARNTDIQGSEFNVMLPNGKSRTLWGSASPLRDDDGQVRGVVAAFLDITERKQAEEDLKHYTVELETANKELEAFSYSVSHDLRTPLRSLDGFSQAVIEEYGDKLDDQGKDYLDRVRKSSQHMSELINDLLKLSRLSRAEIHLQNVNISEIAQSIMEELKNTQPERKSEFILSPGITVKGDKSLLTISLQNLLGNAWKFTGKCPEARIELGVDEQNGEKVYFIKDNGTGFNMQYSDKLFQPFQRLHSDKEYEGTGIGLATVQRVIRRHGGRVWAESEKGKGATFYFTLS